MPHGGRVVAVTTHIDTAIAAKFYLKHNHFYNKAVVLIKITNNEKHKPQTRALCRCVCTWCHTLANIVIVWLTHFTH